MQVSVSPVMGKGFPVDKVPASDFDTMLIFATGTGISPIKALIDAGALDATNRTDVRLYYGATDTAHMAYLNRCSPPTQNALPDIKPPASTLSCHPVTSCPCLHPL